MNGDTRECQAVRQNTGMARGPTRASDRLIKDGTLQRSDLEHAAHEADLLGHPYVAPEHFRLAVLRREGRMSDHEDLRASIPPLRNRGWWQPLGRRSALRPAGRAETRQAQELAQEAERASHTKVEDVPSGTASAGGDGGHAERVPTWLRRSG